MRVVGAPTRLVFVYNVDASPVALLKDLYSAVTTGSTDCHLCDLTFGKVVKDPSWRRFVKSLPYEVDFEMRSTFRKRPDAPHAATFPAAYLETPAGLVEIITSDELNDVDDLDELRNLVTRTLDTLP